MFSDPQFWVAAAFIVFIIAVFNPIRKTLKTSLDSKITEIKKSIEEAENLKNETQVTLSNIKKRQNEVQLEIESIHKNAKEKIKNIENEAQEKLKEQINKKELLAEAKINQLIRDSNNLIKKQISDTAVEASIVILQKKLDEKSKLNLINESIKDLGEVLKN